MLVVHHLENSRSQRILWLLEELGVDYEIKFYERDEKTSLAGFLERIRARPAYRAAITKGGPYGLDRIGQR